MRISWLAAAVAVFLSPSTARAQAIEVSINVLAAEAVLKAVRDPGLTIAEATRIAALPGNQGLIRKARSYGRPADATIFAKALVAAAHRDGAFVDVGRFRFDTVRDHAAQTEKAMAALRDPQLHLLDAVKARIASFTPAALKGRVTGYLVAGGTSGGFAFGDPQFFLNLDRYPSAVLASTIMRHELFHAVQAVARSARPSPPAETACIATVAHGGDMADLFASLSSEGTASYVGDVLALPKDGADGPSGEERARFARNLSMVDRSTVQLELSVHGLTTDAAVTPEEVYALGFYGDEVLYALGYVMARAIAREGGSAAVGVLAGQPGAAFVRRYVGLRSYGKDEDTPALKAATVRLATRLSTCSRDL